MLESEVEARRIVGRVSGLGWAELVGARDRPAPAVAVARVARMVERRQAREPLQYVLGEWGFRGLDLLVDHRVLIPRPETETVVEIALSELNDFARADPVVVDLGTGSGAIALSVATEVHRARVWATDASSDALAVARANLAGSGSLVGSRVSLVEGHWYEALPADLAGHIDLIVSNPPYIAAYEVLPEEVSSWEPVGALVSGPTGLEAVAEVVTGAAAWLRPGGSLVVEIAPHQAGDARGLAAEAGLNGVEVRPDLNGRPRALVARRPTPSELCAESADSPDDPRKVRRPDDLADAVAALAAGQVVVVPTDTVYGLAVSPTVAGATSRLFEVKQRPRDLRLPVLVAGVDQLDGLAACVPPDAIRLMECFWPGALTVVVDLAPGLDLDLGEDAAGRPRTVGVRSPDHHVVQALCRAAGPLAVTSANLHGAPECRTAQEAAEMFGDEVAVIIDGGRCDGTPSTVVDCTGAVPVVLRPGPITEAEIEACLARPPS